MVIPYKCPVCNGSGYVPKEFYYGLSGETGFDECRACIKGIIWDYTNKDIIWDYTNYPTVVGKVKIESNDPYDNCPNKIIHLVVYVR